MSEERDEADEISCDVEQWLIFGVKSFRTVNEAVDSIEARIRAYGDERERAGIERAKREVEDEIQHWLKGRDGLRAAPLYRAVQRIGYLRVPPPESCVSCGGTGVFATPNEFGEPEVHGPCPDCPAQKEPER